ncbi:aspartate aminotransferase family protein [Allobaculum mucilyticum]|uniref:aspartate aminotransferase family protein n=1 Tax=Allobaculum mucilyticum TaxID=2834459 RepID=UPI001E58BC91|nr:aspartate aminotransferase family protein [Allobaculum mucilyticum]
MMSNLNTSDAIIQSEHEHFMPTYARFPVVLDHGEGCTLYDINGKAYLDLTSGIGVNCLGHNYPGLVNAISDQASTLMQASNLYYTKPLVAAGEKLTKLAGMDTVFFANSGAEANEGVIKTARKYSLDKYHDPDRTVILTLKNSFHGRTIATLEATGQDHFHQSFFPFTTGFRYIEANDLDDFKKNLDGTVCAVMMELVQGESGVRPVDKDYVQSVRNLCEENDILFIVDEIQTGIGRTGTFFSYQQYDIIPDLVSCAKGLGGGVPTGAFLGTEKTRSTLQAGDHGTTFGGNALAMAAANVVLDTVGDPNFLNEVAAKGNDLMTKLRAIDSDKILDVRGMGLMVGIEVGPEAIGDALAALREKGVLALKAGAGTIRLLPPLIISNEEIDQAVEAMKEVLA